MISQPAGALTTVSWPLTRPRPICATRMSPATALLGRVRVIDGTMPEEAALAAPWKVMALCAGGAVVGGVVVGGVVVGGVVVGGVVVGVVVGGVVVEVVGDGGVVESVVDGVVVG